MLFLEIRDLFIQAYHNAPGLNQVNISKPTLLVHCNTTEILTIHSDLCTGLTLSF